jgi:FkbM family methyltransferase
MSGSATRRLARRSSRLVPRPLYRHVRHAYQTVANRSYLQSRRELAGLLSQFVARGELVFDIGANVGNYTDVLLTLGARVVAIEPNPVLAQAIRRHYPIAVEAVAVGGKSGSLDLHVGVDPGHSTLSARWLERAPTGHRWSGGAIAVPVVTLDDLAEKHGPPDFVKIDVEGFEAEVLRGCSALPPALSFEYQSANLEVAVECVGMLDGYEFNTVHLQETRLDSAWVMHDELIHRLGEQGETHPDTYGDVYARRLP